MAMSAVSARAVDREAFLVLLASTTLPQIDAFIDECNGALAQPDPVERWRRIMSLLTPALPFAVHQQLYHLCYGNSPTPWPAYLPTSETIADSNTMALCRSQALDAGSDSWTAVHRLSITDRSRFWTIVLKQLNIRFQTAPSSIFDLSEGIDNVEYLPGAKLNIVDSCFQSNGSSVAIRFQRETESTIFEWTIEDLERQVNLVASGLTNAGFVPGDCIAIVLQMTAESVAIYLGIIRAGMVAVSIADSFSAAEIGTRLEIASCKGVFTNDFIYRGGKRLPLYDRVIQSQRCSKAIVLAGIFEGKTVEESSSRPECILRPGDISWHDLLALGTEQFQSVILDAKDPTNILFSSGTTGKPKAVPWSHSTPIKAAADGRYHHNVCPGECVAWPTNFGWMMAPWLCYAALLNGACIALFYGSPTTQQFCEFITNADVSMLGMIPSITKQLRVSEFFETPSIDWSKITRYSSTGEASNPTDQLWLMSRRAGYAPVIEYCGGTEIGGAYLSGSVCQPQAPSWFSTLGLGIDAVLFGGDEDSEGEIGLIGPSLGLSTRLLHQDHFKVYFADMPQGPNGEILRRHGDRILKVNSWYKAMGRADDTMKLSGIKISSVELESVINQHEAVRESAAVAVPPPDSGPDNLCIYVVLDTNSSKAHTYTPQQLKDELNTLIKSMINPLFRVHDLSIIEALPRTATAKVMRRELRAERIRSM